MIDFRKLSVLDGEDVYQMLQTIGENENAFTNPVNGMNFVCFKQWLVQQYEWSLEKNLPIGYVGQTIFWLYDNETPVGIGKIRHALTEHSRKIGGNIGYAISDKYREKGYGTIILKLLLEKAREMNVKEKLLTVEKINPASRRVIEKNGGRLIDENEERWFFSFD
ncbi:MAG: GNAT family N-acetyltransferase [Alphaproteobacteria bacterium]|nr:GNAT family N-acetyltransferase [Alphaproteobacteria bacterium]